MTIKAGNVEQTAEFAPGDETVTLSGIELAQGPLAFTANVNVAGQGSGGPHQVVIGTAE